MAMDLSEQIQLDEMDFGDTEQATGAATKVNEMKLIEN